VESPSSLSYEAQSALIVDLKRSLRDPETAEDTRTLLESLRKRRDLLSAIAEEIDELLTSTTKKPSAEASTGIAQHEGEVSLEISAKSESKPPRGKVAEPPAKQPFRPVTGSKVMSGERLRGAYVGAIVGAVISVLGLVIVTAPKKGAVDLGLFAVVSLVTVGCCAIAGAITGTQRRLIIAALLGAAFGFVMAPLFTALFSVKTLGLEEFVGIGLFFGLAPGAIFGAITGVIFRR
jgi:hypothetical protein